MTVNADNFLEHLKSRGGKFVLWEADIFKLHRAGVSYERIAEFLNINGVKANKMEVYRFIHRKKRKHLLGGVTAENNPRNEHQGIKTPLAQLVLENQQQEQRDGTLPKFNWRESRSKEKPKW